MHLDEKWSDLFHIYILKTQTTRVLLKTIKIVVVHNTMKHNSTVLLIYTYIYAFLKYCVNHTSSNKISKSPASLERKNNIFGHSLPFFLLLNWHFWQFIHFLRPLKCLISHLSFQLHFFCFHYFTPLQYIYFSAPFLDFCNLTLPQSGSHASNHLSPLQVFTRAGHFVPELLLKNTHFSSTTVITYIYTKESTVWHLKFWPHAV